MLASKITILDSILREGAQSEGISFSVTDKLRIAKTLDELEVDYIEAGNPCSNPKELEFFKKAKSLKLKHAKIAAFGATRRRGTEAADDPNIQSLLEAETEVVVIFGKAWDFHVYEIFSTTLQENLNMVKDTIEFFKAVGKEVIFDAEHFFDGYKNNSEYAMKVLKTAKKAGADIITLCDTNGSTLLDEMTEITKMVCGEIDGEIGIHCHNDSGLATANTLLAVKNGISHIQGTMGGIGERCGNANLCVVIPNLQFKMGYSCIPDEKMPLLTPAIKKITEICNIRLRNNMPYVGTSAFAHKAGMHIDAVYKTPRSFEHIDPSLVGNKRRTLVSEVGGRSMIMDKARLLLGNAEKNSEVVKKISQMVKEYEHKGYQFEIAEASFELLVRRAVGTYKRFFEMGQFKILEEQETRENIPTASAMIKVMVDGKEEITAAEGNGPIHALDQALRKALGVFYPNIEAFRLVDYKVRVIDSKAGTDAQVRVLIESTDGEDEWTTVGVSQDIINASWIALVDSVEYKLLKDRERAREI